MMKTIKNKKTLFIVLAIVLIGISVIGVSFSELIYNDEEIVPNTELIYYLDVYYDGVDRDGVKSDDTKISNVSSGYMYVEDKIPDGLTFVGFVTTSDGTIGAVNRNDGTACIGSVVDDTKEEIVNDGTWNSDNTEYYYHGLHYNANTRIVSFSVKYLKAGCKLTVGIKTKTPVNADNPNTPDISEKRMDFYNIATVREDALTKISNILHGYMGKYSGSTLYKVKYQFSGAIPANSPSLPTMLNHVEGSQVEVMVPVNFEGYTFSGWETNDATVENGSFIMPNHDVTFTGSYTELPKYNVKYVINGTKPNGYIEPNERNYYQDNNVIIDNMKANDILNGYTFSGWFTNDVILESDDTIFAMPNHDVTFTGSFTEKKYTITYQFYDTVKPENADSLLPNNQEIKPGTVITLPTINNVPGYEFIGWNKENSFIMPNSNITIYGEWNESNGSFEPTISIEIVDPKEIYHGEDEINFEIKVKNNNDFAINDLIVRTNTDNAEFTINEDYEIQSRHYAKISTLPAGATQSLYATYKVSKDDYNKIINEVEIVGGLTDNHKMLNGSKASVSFDVMSSLTVHHYLYNTTTKVYADEISELTFGSTYETKSIDSSQLFDEYKNKYKVVSDSGNTSGVISNNNVIVTYYYGIDMYHININVIGGVGSVTGTEIVSAGENSKEDIIIKPNQGYEINKIIVNGVELVISNKEEMILDKFNNVREDKNIEVEFVEKDVPAPITGITIKIYIIANIILTLAFVMYILYRKITKKQRGEML